MSSELDGEDWDEGFAEEMIGQTILVGITYVNAADEELSLEQVHGVIIGAEAGSGITVRLQGARAGEMKTLPPSTSWIEVADPGDYTLRSTGERVTDPDLITSYRVRRPDN